MNFVKHVRELLTSLSGVLSRFSSNYSWDRLQQPTPPQAKGWMINCMILRVCKISRGKLETVEKPVSHISVYIYSVYRRRRWRWVTGGRMWRPCQAWRAARRCLMQPKAKTSKQQTAFPAFTFIYQRVWCTRQKECSVTFDIGHILVI